MRAARLGEASRNGVLDLELVVDHRWAQSAWWATVPRLLPLGERDREAAAVELFNLYVSGAAVVALLQIALVSLAVFIMDQRLCQYL